MTLQIPLFSLRHGTAAGLESAVSNLVSGMVQAGSRVELPISSVTRLNPEFANWVRGQSDVSFKHYPLVRGGTWTRFLEETFYYNLETARDPIIFPNYFLPPRLKRRSRRVFAYIHDCQHRVFPQYFSHSKRHWLNFAFRHTLSNAARVLLISEFERSQIARFFGDAQARNCRVVYNPVDWSRYTRGDVSPEIRLLSRERFILSVAHQYVHKNTEKILDAFALVASRDRDIQLVLVGRKAQNVADRLDTIGDPGIRSRIHLTGFIKDADLGHLYMNCQIFVLASEYEGFGMPVVEAMGFGVPVIAADGSSLKEVTLGNGTYVKPDASASEWADSIGAIMRSPPPAAHLAEAAKAMQEKYRPLAVARAVLACVND